MSLAIAEPILAEAAAVPNELPSGITTRGVALSAALHFVLGGLLIVGLPRLFDPPAVPEMPVTVQLVTIAPETRATRPNPNTPRPDTKPEISDFEPPIAKPEPKPEPTKPTPVPSAATIPQSTELPIPPEPKPAPPKPAPVPPAAAAVPSLTEPARPSEPKPAPPLPKPPESKPELKPLEKADPPRPKAKPEPTPQIAKNEAKPEQKRYEPGQFEALLKNLTPQQNAPSPDAAPQKSQVASARASSQPRAPLGGQLTASELDLIRQQISRCWNVPAGARDARDLVVEIRVVVDRDGTVRQATIVDQGRFGSDPFFRAAAESARRAFFNPQCRPLHLPAEKYAIWKDLVVDFSPKDIL